jgi:rhodanese-related sulfurtransferase
MPGIALPWWLPFGKVPEIPPLKLAKDLVLMGSPQVLDVRTDAEFRRGHVRGAVSVPIQTLSARLERLGLERSRPVVAVCLSGHRSIPAVRLLRDHGYDAAQLAGGMLAWRAAGFPEEQG